MMFRVIIEKPEPSLVKLSRKNVAFITINQSEEEERGVDNNAKLIEFYMSS